MRSSVWVTIAAALMTSACSATSESPTVAVTTGGAHATTVASLPTVAPPAAAAEEQPALGLADGVAVVSSVSTGKLIDNRRPDATLQHGVDGRGDGPNPLAPTARFFTGDDTDIVLNLVDLSESDDLNPAGSLFVFQVEGLRLLESSHEKLSSADRRFSWNMMQRGLAGNPGGQWKMSLVNEGEGRVRAQCVVRDEANRVMRVNSSAEILPGTSSTVSCVFDDVNDELWVDVDGRTDDASVIVRKPVDGAEVVVFDPLNGITDEQFGDSNPAGGGTCGGLLPDGIGNAIAVGNKPACGVSLDAEDRFQGEIAIARVWKHR